MKPTLSVFSLFLAVGVTATFAAAPAADQLTIHIAARTSNGLVEILPALSPDRGTLEGRRGCTNGSEECDNSARFRAARANPVPGESLVLFIEGNQPADVVRVRRNGSIVLEQSAPPSELDLGYAVDGEDFAVVVESGSESVELAFKAGTANSSTAQVSAKAVVGGHIANWVYITSGACPTGFYEVIEGSDTGGRCKSYYTDRAQRGEEVLTFFDGSGAAVVGRRYLGSGRVYKVGPVALPTYIDFYVSTNPSDDNLYTFIEGGPQKRVPIGTRPR